MQDTTIAVSNYDLVIPESPDPKFRPGDLVCLGQEWHRSDRYLNITYSNMNQSSVSIVSAIMSKIVKNDGLEPVYTAQYLGHDYMLKMLGIEDEIAPFKRSDRFKKALGIPGFILKGPLAIDESQTRRATIKDTILSKLRTTSTPEVAKNFYYVRFATCDKAIWVEDIALEHKANNSNGLVFQWRKQSL